MPVTPTIQAVATGLLIHGAMCILDRQEVTLPLCLEWSETGMTCTRLEHVAVFAPGEPVNLSLWGEPSPDRMNPTDRVRVSFELASFQPGDVSLDGVVSFQDLTMFHADPYDFNLDGLVNVMDFVAVHDLVVQASLRARR